MNRPTYLIGGGYDKESTYDEWIDAFDGKVKELVLTDRREKRLQAQQKHMGLCQLSWQIL